MCACTIWTDVKLMVFLTSVEPFNRWELLKLILNSRGTGADLPIQSNEAMAFRWISGGLINHLYLHYLPSLWQGAKPRTPTTEFSLTSFPNYFYMVLSGYGDRLSREPWYCYLFLRLRISMLEPTWLLSWSWWSFRSTSHYSNISSLINYCFPVKFAREGIQFPTDQLKIHSCLVCAMVKFQ